MRSASATTRAQYGPIKSSFLCSFVVKNLAQRGAGNRRFTAQRPSAFRWPSVDC